MPFYSDIIIALAEMLKSLKIESCVTPLHYSWDFLLKRPHERDIDLSTSISSWQHFVCLRLLLKRIFGNCLNISIKKRKFMFFGRHFETKHFDRSSSDIWLFKVYAHAGVLRESTQKWLSSSGPFVHKWE